MHRHEREILEQLSRIDWKSQCWLLFGLLFTFISGFVSLRAVETHDCAQPNEPKVFNPDIWLQIYGGGHMAFSLIYSAFWISPETKWIHYRCMILLCLDFLFFSFQACCFGFTAVILFSYFGQICYGRLATGLSISAIAVQPILIIFTADRMKKIVNLIHIFRSIRENLAIMV
jgi:hypothetical protein